MRNPQILGGNPRRDFLFDPSGRDRVFRWEGCLRHFVVEKARWIWDCAVCSFSSLGMIAPGGCGEAPASVPVSLCSCYGPYNCTWAGKLDRGGAHGASKRIWNFCLRAAATYFIGACENC